MVASVFSKQEEFLRILARENPQGNHGWAAEILRQFGELPPEELKRLQARMPFISAILSVREISKTPAELLVFLTELSGILPKPKAITPIKGDWVGKIVKAEVNAWQKFARWKIDQDKFDATLKALGKERVELLIAYGYEFGILPGIVLAEDMDIPGWVKPEPWVWKQLRDGKLFISGTDGKLFQLTEARLPGIPIVFDRQCKPTYQDGRQRWEDDILMEDLIKKLQNENKLPVFDWCDRGSRFGLSRLDYDKLAPKLDEALEFPKGTFRLESVLEWSFLSQYKKGLPRAKDGQTNTWVWFQEFFEGQSHSLNGGGSGGGGLADVSCHSSGGRWSDGSARLLGDLGFLVF